MDDRGLVLFDDGCHRTVVLERVEKGAPPHKVIPNFELDGSSQAFSDWISNLRDSGEMRNDDVTLMRVVLT